MFFTSLHKLTKKGDLEGVKKKLSGSNINAMKGGYTALHLASYEGHLEIVAYLLENGAEIDIKDKNGATPIHAAVLNNQFKTVRYLLEHGANPSSKAKGGYSPLHDAARLGNLEIIKELIEKGAVIDCIDDGGITPLGKAVGNGHKDAVHFLLEKGTLVNPTWKCAFSPLHMVRKNQIEIAYMLFSKGADPNFVGKQGLRPLHTAYDDAERTEILLQHGADVNAEDIKGYTALHFASEAGEKEVVLILLSYGADITIALKGDKKATPLYLAEKMKHKDIIDILERRKEDPGI